LKKCAGNNFSEWGFDSIFEIRWPHCVNLAEFFKDEITQNCPECKSKIKNTSGGYGCGLWRSSSPDHQRNLCSKFRKPKDRFIGRTVF
jgi:hypothetical protein